MESDPWRNRPFWLLFHRRLAELCRVDGGIGLDLVQFGGVSAVQPRELDFERKSYAADVAIVGVIDLSGHSSDGRGAVADDPRQQIRFRVEVQRGNEPPWPATLHDGEVAIADAARRGTAPVGQR